MFLSYPVCWGFLPEDVRNGCFELSAVEHFFFLLSALPHSLRAHIPNPSALVSFCQRPGGACAPARFGVLPFGKPVFFFGTPRTVRAESDSRDPSFLSFSIQVPSRVERHKSQRLSSVLTPADTGHSD